MSRARDEAAGTALGRRELAARAPRKRIEQARGLVEQGGGNIGCDPRRKARIGMRHGNARRSSIAGASGEEKRQAAASFSAWVSRPSSVLRLSGPMTRMVRGLRLRPDRETLLDHQFAFGRQVQAAAAAAGRRIHGDVAERQQAFQVARQRRFLDVERVPDLDGGDAVLLGELGQQRELAGGDAERPQGIVVHARDDAAELAYARGDAGRRRVLGDLADVGRLQSPTPCVMMFMGHPFCPMIYIWACLDSGGMSRGRPAAAPTCKQKFVGRWTTAGPTCYLRITVAVARAAMPSRRPVKPRPSVVVAFTATRPRSMPRISAMRARMASRCGRDLGGLAQQRDVDIADRAAARRARGGPPRPGTDGRRALPARVGVGKDAGRCRPRRWRRAGHRSGRAGPRRHPNGLPARACARSARRTARHDRPARSGARRSPGRCGHRAALALRCVGHGQILRRRELAVGVAARHQRDGEPGPFGHRRIVGQVGAPGGRRRFVRGQDVGEAEALRGLRAPKPARSMVPATRASRPGALQRIGQRHGRNGARRARRARRRTRSMMSDVTNGRTASWISTRSGACARQGAQAIEDRVLARIPARRQAAASLRCPVPDGGCRSARGPRAR